MSCYMQEVKNSLKYIFSQVEKTSFGVEENLCMFLLLFGYICVVVGDPIINRNPINRFNLATIVCLSQIRPAFPSAYVVVFFNIYKCILKLGSLEVGGDPRGYKTILSSSST